MMHLSKRLAARGFTITFVNTQHNHQILARATIPDASLDIRLVAVQDDRGDGRTTGQDSIVEICKSWVRMEEGLGDLIAKLLQENPPPTCIVSDLFGAFTQNVASKFGLPRLAFWTASVPTSLLSWPLGKDAVRQKTPPNSSLGCPEHRLSSFTSSIRTFSVTTATIPCLISFLFLIQGWVRPPGSSSTRLKNSTTRHWMPFGTWKDYSHIYTIGPLLPNPYFSGSVDPDYWRASLWPEENDCLKWLDKQPAASVVFVSFGSIAILSREQFEELAPGLEASEYRLLWVIRSDLLSGESTLLPDGYLERVKDRVHLLSWAPQLQVLTHEATGGFLTHSGWNSTLEAITAGVPMLGWPYFGDQMMNSRCMVDGWKVGLDFEKGGDGMVGRQEVEKKVRQLMEGEQAMELRKNERKWKEAAKRAVQPNGSSTLSWEKLLQSMMTP